MNIRYYSLISIIIILSTSKLSSQVWPINENDDPSSFFIHNCTMGEIHGGGHFHEGIDIDCSTGVNIRSIDDGTVLLAQGDVVEIGHNFDGYVYQQRSFYRHLISINVNNNQGVISGSTIIGKASNHLHRIPSTNHVFPMFRNDLILPGHKCVPLLILDCSKVLRLS